MLGEVDRRSYSPSSPASDTKTSLSTTLLDTPQPPSSPHGYFPPFGLKVDSGMDTMATRQASLVGPHQEPEHEQDFPLGTGTVPQDGTKTENHVIKRRNVGVPKFLRFLFQILEVEDPRIIAWSHDGTAFQIIQPEELATQILPRYFKHNKVSSFQRQLNYFGFKKWTKTQTNICTFSHPFFLQSDKDRMKLIKRKERATPMTLSPVTKPTSIENFHQSKHAHTLQLEDHFEAQDLAHAQTQLPTQQALKRQKSNTVSNAKVAFLNSAAAGRRHSTGMLPGSEAFSLAAAAAAASLPKRTRAGTPAEQEFELEMEARTGAMASAPSTQQHFVYLQQLAKAKHLAQRHWYRGGGNGGRRKSEQLGVDLSGKSLSTNQIDDFMASAPSLTPFPSTLKSDASSMAPPGSATLFHQDAAFHVPRQQDQQVPLRQHMNRHAASRGRGDYGIKTESSTGWLATSGTVYHSQPPLGMPSKFGELHPVPPSQRLQSQDYQAHQERVTWYQSQDQAQQHDRATQSQPARDYIDVLLESAALDENLPLQPSSSLSWHESSYSHIANGSNGAGTYAQQPDHHSHLSPMELPHSFNSRF